MKGTPHRRWRVCLPGDRDANCATCGRSFAPPECRSDFAALQRQRTHGHLFPSRMAPPGRRYFRLWVWQCRECNHLQRDLTVFQWRYRLSRTGGHRRRIAALDELCALLLVRYETDQLY